MSVDLCQTTLDLTRDALKRNELAEPLHGMEDHVRKLLTLCQDSEGRDRNIVMKCMQKTEMMGFPMILPKRSVKLSIHEIIRLLTLGFGMGKIDEKFEIKVISEKRIPYYDGEEVPVNLWGKQYACVLKHEDYTGLLKSYREVVKTARSALTQTKLNRKAYVKRNGAIREELEKMMFSFRVPTRFDMNEPPLVENESSCLSEEEGKTMQSLLSDVSAQAQERQKNEEIPSLFNKNSLKEIRSNKQNILILLDISASTFEKEIFKVANFACASILKTMRHHFPKISISVIPYSDTANASLKNIEEFIAPGGTTAYDEVFQEAQAQLKTTKGFKSVLHISDGFPNDLKEAQLYAQKFPEENIRYGQIIVGHTKRVGDLIDHFQKESLGGTDEENPNRYEKYVGCFSSVAEASKGDQTILWMMEKLPEVMLSMIDLSIGGNFLQHVPQYKDLLEVN